MTAARTRLGRLRIRDADGRRSDEGVRSEVLITGGMEPIDAPAMRLSEVSRRLAISRAAAYRLVRSGDLRGIQVGRTWRVLRADFEAYVDERRADAERRYRQARNEA